MDEPEHLYCGLHDQYKIKDAYGDWICVECRIERFLFDRLGLAGVRE